MSRGWGGKKKCFREEIDWGEGLADGGAGRNGGFISGENQVKRST